MTKKFLVSADHVVAKHACFNLEFVAKVYDGRATPQLWYVSAKGYGCSKNYYSPEAAIRNMLRDHACTNVRIQEVVPFNLAAHELLLTLGFAHARVAADWMDTGDAENGPDLQGHPAFDEYTDEVSHVYVGEDGDTGFEYRDLEMEVFLEKMGLNKEW